MYSILSEYIINIIYLVIQQNLGGGELRVSSEIEQNLIMKYGLLCTQGYTILLTTMGY